MPCDVVWVMDDARVVDDARIMDDVIIFDVVSVVLDVNVGANVVRAHARCACEGGRSGH